MVDWGPSGRLHLRRADDPAKIGCGRPAHGTRDYGEPSPEWVFGYMAQTGLLRKGCLDAFERSTRVYAAPG